MTSVMITRCAGGRTSIAGELDIAAGPFLATGLDARPGEQLRLDLSRVVFADITGTHALMRRLDQLEGTGVDVVVETGSPAIGRALDLMDELLDHTRP